MTIFSSLLPRSISVTKAPAVERIFEVDHNARIMAHCHISDTAKPTVIIVHGLESSSSSPNVVGLANKFLQIGFNVVRMNLRNCGDTAHLTSTLYNAGLSKDVIAVAQELKERDVLEKIFLAGYSLGGNIVLKAAAELGERGCDLLAGVCGISPSIDLAACVDEMEKGFNRLYEERFLYGLKTKIALKHKIYPKLYDVSKLRTIKRLRMFDDCYTCIDAGYNSAAAYYAGASALPIIDRATVPVLIVTAQDDPIVPFSTFESSKLLTEFITMLTPEHGGHGGFFAERAEMSSSGVRCDRFWADNRVVEFCVKIAAY